MKKFPKKAKLISNGGLYRIIDIKEFRPRINFPIFRNITISDPEIYIEKEMKYLLKFCFDRVRGKYAEYTQIDFVEVGAKDN